MSPGIRDPPQTRAIDPTTRHNLTVGITWGKRYPDDESPAEDIRNISKFRWGVLVLPDQELHLDGEETGFECDVSTPGYFFRQATITSAMLKQLNSYLLSIIVMVIGGDTWGLQKSSLVFM